MIEISDKISQIFFVFWPCRPSSRKPPGAGNNNIQTKKKLLAISPFPSLQATVNICRSEESARANERTLSGQSGVAAISTKQFQPDRRSSKGECSACCRTSHAQGESCPASGKSCHSCGKPDHFSPKCPNREKDKGGKVGIRIKVALALNPKWRTSLSGIFRQITSAADPPPFHWRC